VTASVYGKSVFRYVGDGSGHQFRWLRKRWAANESRVMEWRLNARMRAVRRANRGQA
jgi:hypothetical protein